MSMDNIDMRGKTEKNPEETIRKGKEVVFFLRHFYVGIKSFLLSYSSLGQESSLHFHDNYPALTSLNFCTVPYLNNDATV